MLKRMRLEVSGIERRFAYGITSCHIHVGIPIVAAGIRIYIVISFVIQARKRIAFSRANGIGHRTLVLAGAEPVPRIVRLAIHAVIAVMICYPGGRHGDCVRIVSKIFVIIVETAANPHNAVEAVPLMRMATVDRIGHSKANAIEIVIVGAKAGR